VGGRTAGASGARRSRATAAQGLTVGAARRRERRAALGKLVVGPVGTNQHFLPASQLGRFSADAIGPHRERIIWCIRRGSQRPFAEKAENRAYVRGLYDLDDGTPLAAGMGIYTSDGTRFQLFDTRTMAPPVISSIDQYWDLYEGRLPAATDAVLSKIPPSLADWLALALFVAGLFVRAPDYDQRLQRRFEKEGFPGLQGISARDNANVARLIEHSLMVAPVVCADWRVLHAPPKRDFVTNDVGYSYIPLSQGLAYLIPLDRRAALVVARGTNHLEAHYVKRTWCVRGIRHTTISHARVDVLNASIAAVASSEVYGSSSDRVLQAAGVWSSNPHPEQDLRPDPTLLLQGRTKEWLDKQIDLWAKLMTLAAQTPREAGIAYLRFR
jgi:hypothetical protein